MKRNAFFLFAAVLLAGSFHIWTSRVFADAPVEEELLHQTVFIKIKEKLWRKYKYITTIALISTDIY